MNNIKDFDSYVNEEFTFSFFSKEKIDDITNKIVNDEEIKKIPVEKSLKVINNIIKNLWDIWKSSLKDNEKALKVQEFLKIPIWGSIILGIYNLIFNTSTGFLGFGGHIGGMIWFKIAAFIFVLKIMHKIISSGTIFLENIKKFWQEMKDLSKDKTKVNDTVENEPTVKNEHVMAFEKYILQYS